MIYAIRRLDRNAWIDVVTVQCDTAVRDSVGFIGGLVRSGELRPFLPSRYCVIEKRTNGREHRVGRDVMAYPDGKTEQVP